MMNIPLMDIGRQYRSIQKDFDSAIRNILDTATFVGGPDKDAFEKEWAAATGAAACVGVGNGTDSLFLIMKALGLKAGDEVVVPANSFIASSEAVTMTGARPVFVDADPKTFNMDLDRLEEMLQNRSHTKGAKIRALMPVHLYGRIVDMRRVMALAKTFDLHVIEDTAQAHLARIDGKQAGTWGTAGSFSFYPGKNLGAFGDAGAVVTSDVDLAQKIRKLANHGRIGKYDHDIEGYNSRLDSLQAAVLRVKLKYLQAWSDARYQKACVYDKLLENGHGLTKPEIPAPGEHVFHLYVVRVENRDAVLKKLTEKGVHAGVHYPVTLPNLAAYRYLGHRPEDFPVATRFSQQILSLPLFPEITEEEQVYVAGALKEALKAQ